LDSSQQQYGYQSQYDAGAYQYTQVQPQASYVPSQQRLTQYQAPCNRQQTQQQTVLVPAYSVAAVQQMQRQQLQRNFQTRLLQAQRNAAAQQMQRAQRQYAAQQSTVVIFRDPYSGRLYQQRQYLVQQPMAAAGQQVPATKKQDESPASPKQTFSTASPIASVSPDLERQDSGEVKRTSFDSPVTAKSDLPSAEYSVLNGEAAGAASVLESSLPELEAPSSAETPGGLLNAGDNLDLDLPPLELEDAR